MTDLSFGERLAILETIVADMRAEQKEIKALLDDLLAIRNKGVGAFWLASALLGSGIVGLVTLLFSWIKGH